MWWVGSKLVRPVDRVTVEESSEQMGDVDEVLGQMLFHVGHDGEISKVTGPGGISAPFLCKVAAAVLWSTASASREDGSTAVSSAASYVVGVTTPRKASAVGARGANMAPTPS